MIKSDESFFLDRLGHKVLVGHVVMTQHLVAPFVVQSALTHHATGHLHHLNSQTMGPVLTTSAYFFPRTKPEHSADTPSLRCASHSWRPLRSCSSLRHDGSVVSEKQMWTLSWFTRMTGKLTDCGLD